MFNRGTILDILSFLIVFNINGNDCYEYHKNGSNDFDVLIFTQRWPPTVCYTWKENSPSHTCSFPKERNEWTIHGIWPSKYHKMGPQFCNKSMPFDATVLKPMEKELQEKWIDIEYGRDSYSLWEHEWMKHGTCAAVLKQLSDEMKYFSTGLRLSSMYDMKNVLGKADIVPGRTYSTIEYLQSIERVLGKRGTVICRQNKETGESYIFEIRICLDKTLQLANCDGISDYPTNCGNLQAVTYPDDVPKLYHVVQV